MLQMWRLRPLLPTALRALTSTPTTPPISAVISPSLRLPFSPSPPPHHFLQLASVSGTPKGKARLKTIQALKKKSFTQKKKGGADDPKSRGGKGFLPTKSRPVILRLNAKLRQREAEREKLGLVSKLRLKEIAVQKARAASEKVAEGDAPTTMMGPRGLTLTSLGLVDAAAVPEYRLTVEDGRRLAKEYSRLLMRWNRQRQVADTGLMELRKEAIEALPEKLRIAALMPAVVKKKKKVVDEKKGVAKGKGKAMARKRPGVVPGKKGGGGGKSTKKDQRLLKTRSDLDVGKLEKDEEKMVLELERQWQWQRAG